MLMPPYFRSPAPEPNDIPARLLQIPPDEIMDITLTPEERCAMHLALTYFYEAVLKHVFPAIDALPQEQTDEMMLTIHGLIYQLHAPIPTRSQPRTNDEQAADH